MWRSKRGCWSRCDWPLGSLCNCTLETLEGIVAKEMVGFGSAPCLDDEELTERLPAEGDLQAQKKPKERRKTRGHHHVRLPRSVGKKAETL